MDCGVKPGNDEVECRTFPFHSDFDQFGHPASSHFDMSDLIEAWLRLVDELAEARPFLAELG
jgi:hypothetical protein